MTEALRRDQANEINKEMEKEKFLKKRNPLNKNVPLSDTTT